MPGISLHFIPSLLCFPSPRQRFWSCTAWEELRVVVCPCGCLSEQWQGTAVKCELSLQLPGSLPSLGPALITPISSAPTAGRESGEESWVYLVVPGAPLLLLSPRWMSGVYLHTHLELLCRNIPVPFHWMPCTPCSRHTPQLPVCSWLSC